MKVLFVYPSFERHADSHPELRDAVPLNEYLGSPSLGMACLKAVTPSSWEVEFRDDRIRPADRPTDADLVALSFFTASATRALALADYFRALGKQVVCGGLFPTALPEVVAPHVDALVIGEGELVWPRVLEDAARGGLKSRYVATTVADPERLRPPDLSLYFDHEDPTRRPDDYPLQISRGCGLSCDACVLPLSMGNRIRALPRSYVKAQLSQLAASGKHACLTEDTGWFPGRPRRHLADVLSLIGDTPGAAISYLGTSMPMLLVTPKPLLDAARTAGVGMFYLVGGFDPITRHAFTGRSPRALERAHRAVKIAHDAGIEPYTSFLIGNDDDDPGTVDRILEFCANAKISKAEFAIATPYPGTPRWRHLVARDRLLHRHWAKYNDANVVFDPAKMTPDELQRGYLRLWREFYADKAHVAERPYYERTIQF